ncbi:hypothetical protein D3C75_940860 [compost metagenome]
MDPAPIAPQSAPGIMRLGRIVGSLPGRITGQGEPLIGLGQSIDQIIGQHHVGPTLEGPASAIGRERLLSAVEQGAAFQSALDDGEALGQHPDQG